MASLFCLKVEFLDPAPTFHGKGAGGEPEWPPSPLRLFQALVAASAARWGAKLFAEYASPALTWLESFEPVVVAPSVQSERTPYRMYVPNNAGDLVAAEWSRGMHESSMAKHRVEKDIRPTRLVGGNSVQYLWELPDPIPPRVEEYLTVLSAAARSITHLGWGIDIVTANGKVISTEDAVKLSGKVWRPSKQSGGEGLRVPVKGTLDALIAKHQAFLCRLGPDGFRPVPPLSAFRVVTYRRADDAGIRPWAAFKLIRADSDGMAYYPATRAVTVAGMVRHAVSMAAEATGWPRARIDQFVLGHRDNPEDVLPRFAFLPLPSIEPAPRNIAGGIRRVLVAEPIDAKGDNIAWAKRIVSGQAITRDDGELVAYLEGIAGDGVVARYVPRQGAKAWTTVTPVALPGCDEGAARKTDKLLDRMFRHSGYSIDMVENLELQRTPFLRGAEDAKRYRPGGTHYLSNCTMYHMRIRWKKPMRGPIALGSGRFCGLGVFIADQE